MTTQTTTSATIPAAEAVELPTELRCFDCGYDLRGQPPEGRCPECGLAVAGTLDRLRKLQERGDPRPLRRAAGFILAAGGVFALMIAAFIGAIMLPFSVIGRLEWVLVRGFIVGTLIGTLAMALLWGLSAGTLARSAAPGPTRRILGLLAWVVPALVSVLWLLTWADSVRYGLEPEIETVMQAVAVTCWFAGGLFPPISLIEIRRRVRLWPHWRWLGKIMYVVLWPLWAGFAGASTALLFNVVADNYVTLTYAGGYPAMERPDDWLWLRQAMTTLGSIASLLLLFAVPAYLACLILTLIGLRRLRRLRQQVPAFEHQPTPSGSTSRTSS